MRDLRQDLPALRSTSRARHRPESPATSWIMRASTRTTSITEDDEYAEDGEYTEDGEYAGDRYAEDADAEGEYAEESELADETDTENEEE